MGGTTKKNKILFIAAALLALAASSDMHNRITTDETLMIPGIGAEKILLGETSETVISRRGAPLRTVKAETTGEVFETIFTVKTDLKIPFDAIYYYGEGKGIIFFHMNVVSAIAGSARNRVTVDAVSLEKGMQQFIFHYGNEGLMTVPKGKHRAYCYPRKGIALFDDDGNDGIDLYIVFKASELP